MVDNLTPAQAELILRFLGSAHIVGSDAPAFIECVMALRVIALSTPSPPATGKGANAE